MPTRIITNAEIKKIIGNGSASDVLVEMWNDAATEKVCSILGVSDIAKHQVTEERVDVISAHEMILSEFPVDTDQTITLKTTFDRTAISGYVFRKDPQKLRTVRLYDSSGNIPYNLNYPRVLVSYMAGYTTQDTVEVLDLTGLTDKTFTVTIVGTTTTWTIKASGATGNQINIGVTLSATASAIASALGGTADGAIVTLPLGSKITLGTATTTQLEVINSDVPKAIKNAIALIAGGGLAEQQKGGGVVSYTIGGKSVTFRNDAEASAVQVALNTWLSAYKKTKILGI